MRESIETLFTQVIVRRICAGSAPFTREVHGGAIAPIYVSAERYKSMDAAFAAGRARLAEFIPSKKFRQGNRGGSDTPVPDDNFEMSVSS